MFDRLKRVFASLAPPSVLSGDELSAWAQRQGLRRTPSDTGVLLWEGAWLGGGLVAQFGPPTRPYISGQELSLKADLGLLGDVRVVLMNRALKQSLQTLSNRLFSEVTDALQTTDKPLPEEVGWLSLYRDAGWSGPPEAFWSRFAVLTDAPETARQWLDAALVTELYSAAQSWSPALPVWFGMMRGKLYLRAQWPSAQEEGAPAEILRCFEQLALRAQSHFVR